MGYVAIKNSSSRKPWGEYIKPWRTCLRRDSIIVSFCLICAIRYSRLLIQGEKSDDGVGEGIRDGEGETESVDEIEGDEQREYIAREKVELPRDVVLNS